MAIWLLLIPQRYEFSSKSQPRPVTHGDTSVVADTTKVRIFKQITTSLDLLNSNRVLLLIPQRYEFSSKSQLPSSMPTISSRCCWYHKGTNFQANHNPSRWRMAIHHVVADTTKVRIFKQITTLLMHLYLDNSCCWYHKGTNFQANHNYSSSFRLL